MGLREVAQSDMRSILNDGAFGFGWPIRVIDPLDITAPLTGFSNDISEVIDPETGVAVSGRYANVALAIRDLTDAGLGIPRNITDLDSRPWRVTFLDIEGQTWTFKVVQSNPDRALGIVTCVLEAFDAN